MSYARTRLCCTLLALALVACSNLGSKDAAPTPTPAEPTPAASPSPVATPAASSTPSPSPTPLPTPMSCLSDEDCAHLAVPPCLGAHCEDSACIVEFLNEGEVCDDGELCTVRDACRSGVCLGSALPCEVSGCRLRQCEARGKSEESCETLGWSVRGGDPEVCASSALSEDGDCSGELDFTAAAALCSSLGARLCTLPELLDGEARSQECGYNRARVWTSTPCEDGGFATVAGAPAGLEDAPLRCDPAELAEGVVVRCCADVAPALVEPICAERIAACVDDDPCTTGRCGSDGVCRQDPTNCDDGDVCNGAEHCEDGVGCQPGEALECVDDAPCTLDECDPVDGCVFPPKTCDDGIECTVDTCLPDGSCRNDAAAADDSSCSDGDPCTELDSCSDGVCAGLAITCESEGCRTRSCVPLEKSERSCEALRWNAQRTGSRAVCGESEAAFGEDGANACSGTVDFATAEAGCEAIGARLCSVDELEADEARGTGCSYDNARVWSRTPCEGGGFVSAAGASGSARTHPPQCSSADEAYAVRCCADVEPEQPSPECRTQIASCDDGDACTLDECSREGRCEFQPRACDDGNFCNGFSACDSERGCLPPEDLICEGGSTCLAPACVPAAGCTLEPVEGVICGVGRSCQLGRCEPDDCFALPEGVLYAEDFAMPNVIGWSAEPSFDSSSTWRFGEARGTSGAFGDAPAVDHSPTDDQRLAGTSLGNAAPFSAVGGGQDCLQSPVFSLIDAPTPLFLSLWRRAHVGGACNESLVALVGPPHDERVELWRHDCETDGPLNDAEWVHMQFDISAHRGAHGWAFDLCTQIPGPEVPAAERSAGWSIDDVSISTTPEGCFADPPRCLDPSRYCEPTGHAASALNCEALGWGRGPVCANSDIPECHSNRSHAEAESQCRFVGARLCSAEELEMGETQGTGCGFDAWRIWSATPCEGGFETRAGRPDRADEIPPACTPADTNEGIAVRCCADAY